jgi:hypothetical protein
MATRKAANPTSSETATAEQRPQLYVGQRVWYGVEHLGGEIRAVFADVLELDGDGLPTLEIHHPSGAHGIQQHVEGSDELAPMRWTWAAAAL